VATRTPTVGRELQVREPHIDVCIEVFGVDLLVEDKAPEQSDAPGSSAPARYGCRSRMAMGTGSRAVIVLLVSSQPVRVGLPEAVICRTCPHLPPLPRAKGPQYYGTKFP
jgi:hypothetical protein